MIMKLHLLEYKRRYFYFDLFDRYDRYGIGTLIRIDKALSYVGSYAPYGSEVILNVPANYSTKGATFKVFHHLITRSIAYANGLETVAIYPYIDWHRVRNRRKLKENKVLYGVIAYLIYLRKDRTYKIDNLLEAYLVKGWPFMSYNFGKYIWMITKEKSCVRYAWNWMTTKKYFYTTNIRVAKQLAYMD